MAFDECGGQGITAKKLALCATSSITNIYITCPLAFGLFCPKKSCEMLPLRG